MSMHGATAENICGLFKEALLYWRKDKLCDSQ